MALCEVRRWFPPCLGPCVRAAERCAGRYTGAGRKKKECAADQGNALAKKKEACGADPQGLKLNRYNPVCYIDCSSTRAGGASAGVQGGDRTAQFPSVRACSFDAAISLRDCARCLRAARACAHGTCAKTSSQLLTGNVPLMTRSACRTAVCKACSHRCASSTMLAGASEMLAWPRSSSSCWTSFINFVRTCGI